MSFREDDEIGRFAAVVVVLILGGWIIMGIVNLIKFYLLTMEKIFV